MDWDSYLMTGPDPRYFTLLPPAKVDKSTPDQVVDHLNQQRFRQAVMNVLYTSIAEKTLARIVDGLPLKDVALDLRAHRHRIEEPMFNHTELCPGMLENSFAFREDFEPLTLDIPSRVQFHSTSSTSQLGRLAIKVASLGLTHFQVLHCYQNEPLGSKASRLPFIELIAVAIHSVAVKLFKLDTSMHEGDKWPSDGYYESNSLFRWVTPFSVFSYAEPDQYPDGIADVVGYWAEDRIFDGVVLFGRGETGT